MSDEASARQSSAKLSIDEPSAPASQLEGISGPVGQAMEDGASKPAVRAHFRSAPMPSGPFWIALLLAILGVVIFATAASGLFVFGVGVAIAFFLVPVVNWLERHGWNRIVAAIVAVVITVMVALILLGAVVLIVVNQGIKFVVNLPTYLADLGSWYASMDLPEWLRAGIDAIISTAEDNLEAVDEGTVVAGFLGGFFGLIGGLFVWFLLPFFLFYLLKDQPRMAATFYERVPAPWKDDVARMLTITVGDFAQYFKAEFLVGGLMFVFITLGVFLIGLVTDTPSLMQFALLLGLIAFVMELIPQIGPIISYIPALILSLSGGPDVVIVVSVFYFIAFNIEGSILVPTFEGRMISFNGATVLVLIAIGFILAGIIGAILALPVASIIRDLFRLFFDKAVQDGLVVEEAEADRPTLARSSEAGGSTA